jgi:hypothetical protein
MIQPWNCGRRIPLSYPRQATTGHEYMLPRVSTLHSGYFQPYRSTLKLLLMAIAVKKELANAGYAALIQSLTGEGRTGLKLTCPQGQCRQEYVVYFGSATEEEEMRWLFDRRVGQHHPFHLDVYALDEPMPRWAEPERAAMPALPVRLKEPGESISFDVFHTMRQKMRLRGMLPADLAQSRKPPGLLGRTSKVFAGCLAFAVAAVPIAARTPFLFGSK